MAHDLTAKLAADGSAAAGDHNHLILQEIGDLVGIQLYGGAAQQVFHLTVLDGGQGDRAVHQLINAGQHADAHAGALADVQNLFFLFRGGRGDGEEDLGDALALDGLADMLSAADNADAIEVLALLDGVGVDDASDLDVCVSAVVHLLQQHLTGFTGTDQQDALLAGRMLDGLAEGN